jgi:hypothetical protein
MVEQSIYDRDSELEFVWKEFVEEKQKLSRNRARSSDSLHKVKIEEIYMDDKKMTTK